MDHISMNDFSSILRLIDLCSENLCTYLRQSLQETISDKWLKIFIHARTTFHWDGYFEGKSVRLNTINVERFLSNSSNQHSFLFFC